MSNRSFIGIGGWAGAGKDTLADLLVEHYGYVKLSFASPMREMIEAIDPVVGFTEDGPLRYNDVVDLYGYREAKDLFPEVRQFLQRLGTEAGRKVLGENVWVHAAFRRADRHDRVVFADMRFRNEATAIANALSGVPGRTVRVMRPGVTAANDHASEHDLDNWNFDATIHNNGSIEELLLKLDGFMARHVPSVLRRT